MALIDDIEFYGRAVDAGELTRQRAAELLSRASRGGLTLAGAATAIDEWDGTRDRMRSLSADIVDTLRATQNGRPIPDHVKRNNRARTLASLRRSLRKTDDWDETPAEAAAWDRRHFDRDED
ncbi:hypothetical protein OOK27_05430 [Streptomyces canus]|uniref:hypothetical protein n=1 Tax=Streptomyces canus TaxID=58343 RepID=UPI00224D2891|nr:hypothetical protein [Streptomyces canus]MCX5253615.1 hypothetical protein [Streptomyces canus]